MGRVIVKSNNDATTSWFGTATSNTADQDSALLTQTVSGDFDYPLFAVILGLVVFGLVMVYSASAFVASQRYGEPFHFFERQLIAASLGTICMLIIAHIDYSTITRLTYPALAVGILLLVVVLIPPFGRTVGGARRWLHFGGATLQPSELIKPILVLYFAQLLARDPKRVRSFHQGLLPSLLVMGAVVFLLILEPDLGTALMIATVILCMLFVAGAPIRHLAALSVVALPVVALLVWNVGYRRRRLLAFLDPWADPTDSGFQIIQSFLAFGTGGLFGRGLGQGRQKLFFLPEPHTDFTFSVIGEELGMIGAVVVALVFVFFVWRGILIANRAPDRLGALLASGITAMIGTQALLHMGVAVSLLPTKGLPLPFLSYGGSSLLATLLGCGLLLSVSAKRGGQTA